MHCLLKWLDTEQSKEQCPLDRRKWGESVLSLPFLGVHPFASWRQVVPKLTAETADRKPDRLPTTVDGAPVATMAPGPIHGDEDEEMDDGELDDSYEDSVIAEAAEAAAAARHH
jgi:anaphase-promoting complex subunit 11